MRSNLLDKIDNILNEDINVEFKDETKDHKRIIVTTRGRSYYMISAEPFPTKEEVEEMWKDKKKRKLFRPHIW